MPRPDDRTPAEVAAYLDVDAVLSRAPLTLAELYPAPREMPRASIEATEADAPAHWASAVVNGDWSGLDDVEARAARAWLERAGGHVVDVGEPWIGTYRPAFGAPLQCEMATYTVLVER